MYISNLVFIPLVIIWVICLISSLRLDNMKKEKIDEKFRVIKRTISYIIFTISTFAHLILMFATNTQEAIIADIIQMAILIPISIIFFYINKTKKLGE